MRIFLFVLAGLAGIGGAIYWASMPMESREDSPFGYTAIVAPQGGEELQTCGLSYLGRSDDKKTAFKMSLSTRLLTEKAMVEAFEVYAMSVTDQKTMSGQQVEVVSALLKADGVDTSTLKSLETGDTKSYIAYQSGAVENTGLTLDILRGSHLRMRLAGESGERSYELPPVPGEIVDSLTACFGKIKDALSGQTTEPTQQP
jgi:hypothetical protein